MENALVMINVIDIVSGEIMMETYDAKDAATYIRQHEGIRQKVEHVGTEQTQVDWHCLFPTMRVDDMPRIYINEDEKWNWPSRGWVGWVNLVLNSEMGVAVLGRPESVESTHSGIAIEFDEDLCDPQEPGVILNVRWVVDIFLSGQGATVQSLSPGRDQVFNSVDINPWKCSAKELLKAIREVCRSVPTEFPDQPDTPSLQDRFPDHPRFDRG